jgi:predicted dehydrogenase
MSTRRSFIKNSALAAGGFFIVPRHVLGRGFVAPSDKLNIAAVGAGGKGASDITHAWNNGANNVVALCDIDWKHAEKTFEKFPKAARYKDYRRMLESEKSIDAITISTPDHMHAPIAMAAMQLGKHVYVQKPLTHNISEARLMTETARKQQVVTQMGNQGASSPGTKKIVEWIAAGKIGKVHTVHVWTDRPVWPQGIPVPTDKPDVPEGLAWDLWNGVANPVQYTPAYHPFKWRGWWAFGTGALGDLGCHLMDMPFRSLKLGYPTEVECSVGQVFKQDWVPEWIPEGCPPASRIQIKFPGTKFTKGDVTMTWSDGGIRPFYPEWIPANDYIGEADGKNGVLMIGTKGVMSFGIFGRDLKVYNTKGVKTDVYDAGDNDWNKPPLSLEYNHQISWTEACKAGFGSEAHKALTSSFDFSGPLTETVLMGNLAIRSYALRTELKGGGHDYPGRKKLLWDGKNMRITNFEAANQFVSRDYRTGW